MPDPADDHRLAEAVDRLAAAAARGLAGVRPAATTGGTHADGAPRSEPARRARDRGTPPSSATLEDLRATVAATVDALLEGAEAAGPERRPELLRLLGRADRMEARVRRTTVAAAERRRTLLDRALEQLRGLATTEELLAAAAPLALQACQARRAALGRIRDDVWSPWLTAIDRDPTGGAHRPGRRAPRALDDLPLERRVATSGRAHRDASPSDEDGRPVVTIVAPVLAGGVVLAVLEVRIAPPLVDAGTVADVERVGDALGRAFEVLAVRDRAAAQVRAAASLRADLRAASEPSAGPVDELPTAEAGARPVVGAPAGTAGRSALTSALTPRQRETLELMARGLSNAEIADRLVVGVPTVKSHVTAILRAAGALNRAEAIKRHLEDSTGARGGA